MDRSIIQSTNSSTNKNYPSPSVDISDVHQRILVPQRLFSVKYHYLTRSQAIASYR